MEENKIRKYAQLMRELELSGLEVRENGVFIRLERSAGEIKRIIETPIPLEAVSEAPPPEPAVGIVDIASPLVGVFYMAPDPQSPPYVRVGDTVRPGQVLGIIEAMKLMNEITADQGGTIVEICVGNEQIVDFGHVLFRLKKE